MVLPAQLLVKKYMMLKREKNSIASKFEVGVSLVGRLPCDVPELALVLANPHVQPHGCFLVDIRSVHACKCRCHARRLSSSSLNLSSLRAYCKPSKMASSPWMTNHRPRGSSYSLEG